MLGASRLPLRSATVLATLAVALTAAGSAAGATTTPPPTKPAKASVRVYIFNAFWVHRQPVIVPDRALHIGAVVRPYVPGQWVKVRAYVGRRLIKVMHIRLRRSANGRYGHFNVPLKSSAVGNVMVLVGHSRTPQMLSFLSRRDFGVLDTHIGFGSTGRFVELIQQQLAALHFYIPQSGVYDGGTGLALDAFHRLLHWGTYQSVDSRTVTWLLNGWGSFKVRYPHHGKHAEGNLSLQLLALINGSHVYQIYPISSGKPSTPTILGSFRVYRKVPGYLPDGMYYSSFFYSGYAIHGYNPAPDYPASHGCMRLPIADATSAYGWLDVGDGVDTYY